MVLFSGIEAKWQAKSKIILRGWNVSIDRNIEFAGPQRKSCSDNDRTIEGKISAAVKPFESDHLSGQFFGGELPVTGVVLIDFCFLYEAEDITKVCNSLDELVNKLEREAEIGQKKIFNEHGALSSSFEMYQSDIFLSNNSIQAFIGEEVFTYITFNTFNHLMTYQPEFSDECRLWVEQLRSKSVLLSEVSEKLRYQFFVGIRKKLDDIRYWLSHG